MLFHGRRAIRIACNHRTRQATSPRNFQFASTTRLFSSSQNGYNEVPLSDVPNASSSFPAVEDIAALHQPPAVVAEVAEPHAFPVEFAMKLLTNGQDLTGLPWWATIMVVTWGVRTMLMPLIAGSFRNNAALAAAKPEMEALNKKYEMFDKNGTEYNQMEKPQEMQAIMNRHGCNPLKSFVPMFFSGPIFVTFFFSIRGLAEDSASFAKGGALWFQDLSLMDPNYALPVVSSVSMLIAMELGGDSGQQAKQMGMMKNIFRGICVAMVPLCYHFPAGVFVYWISSNTFSIFQGLFFKNKAVKSFFKIPDMPKIVEADEVVNPYTAKVEAAQKKHAASEIRYLEKAERPQKSKAKRTRRR